MRKRSKEEVKIRNALSELFVFSLGSGDGAFLLYTVLLYCEYVCSGGENRVRLGDLLGKDPKRWGSWKEVSKEPGFQGLFEVDSEDNIRIRGDFEDHLPIICAKVRGYWGFLSRLCSGEKRWGSGVQDAVAKGVLLFNEGFYFECHELLEGAWKEEKGREKSFLKGLIHAAVAFYHLECGNYKGAAHYLIRSHRRLKGFEPAFLGMDVKAFLTDIEAFLDSLRESESPVLKSMVPRMRSL
ncbi:MAG TPA: DUF309 domain-containing protein [Thermodesulfobacteriota bacterium]|nr:DUF309 domain-containing protein [Thermodesulfobacteriota bacterium]